MGHRDASQVEPLLTTPLLPNSKARGAPLPGVGIEDPATDLLYLAGENADGRPTLYRSTEGGDNWSYYKSFDTTSPDGQYWNIGSGFSKLASARFVILLSSFVDSVGGSNAFFLRYDTAVTAI